MTPILPLPRPGECPDHIDWDTLSPTAQHGLTARLEQCGRIDLDDDETRFVRRLIAGARRAS